jgi:hypothetical protein
VVNLKRCGYTVAPKERGKLHSIVMIAYLINIHIIVKLFPFQAPLSFGEGLGVRPVDINRFILFKKCNP